MIQTKVDVRPVSNGSRKITCKTILLNKSINSINIAEEEKRSLMDIIRTRQMTWIGHILRGISLCIKGRME